MKVQLHRCGDLLNPGIPKLVFLFGLAGVGKSYVGKIVAERFGYIAYDLDSDLTPAMREAIARRVPFTEEMRDEFFDVVVRRITELSAEHSYLVLMQGAYKERHRAMVRQVHPEIQFVWIDAPIETLRQRLTARADAISPDYASSIMSHFEPPREESSLRLVNDTSSREELARRFEGLFTDSR